MSINELSPGNKLSLKGKLFELQRKLSLLDLEKRISEEYPFQPQFYSPPAAHIGDPEARSVKNTAKMAQLASYVKSARNNDWDDETEFTFQPQLNHRYNNRSKVLSHVRGYDAHKHYMTNKQETRERASKVDLTKGTRLFHPTIYTKKENKDNDSSSVMSEASSAKACDSMYDDAMARVARMKKLQEDAVAERNAVANRKKKNSKSDKILEQKAERRIRLVFDAIDRESTGKLTLKSLRNCVVGLSQHLAHINAQSSSNTVDTNASLIEESLYKIIDVLWDELDKKKAGEVDLGRFHEVCFPVISRMFQSMYNSHRAVSAVSGASAYLESIGVANVSLGVHGSTVQLCKSGTRNGADEGFLYAFSHGSANPLGNTMTSSPALSKKATASLSQSYQSGVVVTHKDAIRILFEFESELAEVSAKSALTQKAAEKRKEVARRQSLLSSARNMSPASERPVMPSRGRSPAVSSRSASPEGGRWSRPVSPMTSGTESPSRSPSPRRSVQFDSADEFNASGEPLSPFQKQQRAMRRVSTPTTSSASRLLLQAAKFATVRESLEKSARSRSPESTRGRMTASELKPRAASAPVRASIYDADRTFSPQFSGNQKDDQSVTLSQLSSLPFMRRLSRAALSAEQHILAIKAKADQECTFQPHFFGKTKKGNDLKYYRSRDNSPRKHTRRSILTMYPPTKGVAKRTYIGSPKKHSSPEPQRGKPGWDGNLKVIAPTRRLSTNIVLNNRVVNLKPFTCSSIHEVNYSDHEHSYEAGSPLPSKPAPGASMMRLFGSVCVDSPEQGEDFDNNDEKRPDKENINDNADDTIEITGELQGSKVSKESHESADTIDNVEALNAPCVDDSEPVVAIETAEMTDLMEFNTDPIEEGHIQTKVGGRSSVLLDLSTDAEIVEGVVIGSIEIPDSYFSPQTDPQTNYEPASETISNVVQSVPFSDNPVNYLEMSGFEATYDPNLPVHERLYKTRRKSDLIADIPRPPTQKELDDIAECTFKPEISYNFAKVVPKIRKSVFSIPSDVEPTEGHSPLSSPVKTPFTLEVLENQSPFAGKLPDPPKPSGYEEYLKRIRKAQEMKRQEKESFDNLGKITDRSYKKSRELALQGFKTFDWPYEKLRKDKGGEENLTPAELTNDGDRFVVNVKLAVNRIVPVTVHLQKSAHEQAVAFAKIHTLDDSTVGVLTGVLQQHIDAKRMMKMM